MIKFDFYLFLLNPVILQELDLKAVILETYCPLTKTSVPEILLQGLLIYHSFKNFQAFKNHFTKLMAKAAIQVNNYIKRRKQDESINPSGYKKI